MPAEKATDPDPGLARARTALAWTRTAISFAALGMVILKSNRYVGIPVVALAAVIWPLGRMARAPRSGRSRSRHMLLIAVAVTGVSLVALVLSLIGPEPAGLRP
jgi:uncharacterized membrane protein YidH (DUF202 family)